MAMGERPIMNGDPRRPVRPPVAQPPAATPVVPPPTTTPRLPVPKPARRPGLPAGGDPSLRPGQRPPNPATDPLPPAWAKLVAGGMSEAEARRRWAGRLQSRGKIPGAGGPAAPPPGPGAGTPAGPAPGAGAAPPPGSPFVPAPPGTPVGNPFMPPMPQVNGPTAGSPLGSNDFRDPMMQFLSAVPVMNANMTRQIGDSMAQAGFSGNRWGTSAMNAAGQIGAENALTQNAMMQNLLADYANRQEDRALQATGMSMSLGDMLDRQAQDRFMLPATLGQWEMGRQDDFSKMAYEDFERNKLGWLPMLLGAAQSQGAGSPGQIVPITEPGKPGAADWMTILAGLLG